MSFIWFQLPENCPYLGFFWSVFSRIWIAHGEIRSIQSGCGKTRTGKIRMLPLYKKCSLYLNLFSVEYQRNLSKLLSNKICESKLLTVHNKSNFELGKTLMGEDLLRQKYCIIWTFFWQAVLFLLIYNFNFSFFLLSNLYLVGDRVPYLRIKRSWVPCSKFERVGFWNVPSSVYT